jgi:hypothetical protein
MADCVLAFPFDDELGNPQQNTFDLGVGESADGLASLVGEILRQGIGCVDGTVAVENGNNVRGLNPIKAAVAENRFDGCTFRRISALQRV